ncbi:right-handed parallel beta-helix repeat-containing protein [Wenyingzhuangia aestuarii]|uniref:right-handed parallel beta-helix repeat-containing protein n=1 Tax=Wenyingzhuangia aestuarii TaxID=1647582 RepID=UPI00143B7061|nr:right-handed parallel beta-helix repeat-containing protein [Wenyingzhuangia aestuarii]NJB83793.1 hypothetical protein [Wenyingzhuangia aestuarii]
MKLLKIFFKIGFVLLLMSQLSCRKDFDTQISNGNLSFSVDTLFLDTVFNNLSTTTHRLTVYNKSKNDITIPKIKLAKNDSKYRINVDGITGTEFEDVLLLKKDSIFVFVEVTADVSDTNSEMLYEDQILFDPNGNQQDVDLVTLVQDAELLFPTTGTDFELSQTVFTNTKPYVIYGNAIVPENGSLTIDAGSVIHFSNNASLTISSGATLNINGTLTDSIVFKGDKLSYQYDDIPGQWNGIKLKENTTVAINFLKILNPSTGIEIIDNTNTATINNTEIYYAADYGIYTQNANITANNLVIGQAGKSDLFLQGGNYTFNHCTFANYWSKGLRFKENLYLANYYVEEDTKINLPLQSANFTNCIVVGTKTSEIDLDKNEEEPIFNFQFKNCLINLEKGEDLLDTDNSTFYTDVLFNKKTDFKNTGGNDLRIGLENEGINQADPTTANSVPLDILGTDRTTAPDIGAYQHIDFTTLEPTEEDE